MRPYITVAVRSKVASATEPSLSLYSVGSRFGVFGCQNPVRSCLNVIVEETGFSNESATGEMVKGAVKKQVFEYEYQKSHRSGVSNWSAPPISPSWRHVDVT
jgi:hypothetical protein